MFSIGWKTKFGFAVEELSRAKEHIKTLEEQVRGLQSDIAVIKEKHTLQCLDVNRARGALIEAFEQITVNAVAISAAFTRIITLEQHHAKREEAYQAQEDAYEERMRPTMSQDLD